MTKNYFIFVSAVTASFLLNACSPVNSVAPFDDKQAAIVARSMMPPTFYLKKQAHGSAKNSTRYESSQ